jgi:hypothetical protein
LKEKTIIILAMGDTRAECDFKADEVYSVNNGYKQIYMEADPSIRFISKIFLAHKLEAKDENGSILNWNDFNHLHDKEGVDIINTHRCVGLKSRMYPSKRISKKFDTDYFSNTISYMLAYAIDEATVVDKETKKLKLKYPLKLRLFGVDMRQYDPAGGGEYQLEKGGVEFWLGIAKGLGVEYTISEGSTLLKTVTGKPYGYKYFDMKRIDPLGLLKKKKKPVSTSTSPVYEGELKITIEKVT